MFEAKKISVMQKLGDLGASGSGASKFVVKNVVFLIADPDLRIISYHIT